MAGVETDSDFGAAPAGPADRWKAEIEAFETEREAWRSRVRKIERRYRDERRDGDDARRFALLWANVEVLAPTLYAKPPKADVGRRYRDRDPVGRVAGQVLERNLDAVIERAGAFDRTMQSCVKDLLLGGQGTGWVRYDVQFSTAEVQDDEQDDGAGPDDDDAGEAGGADPAEAGEPAGEGGPSLAPAAAGVPVATMETALFDYVHWDDFGFTAGARVWDEVGEVWRRSYLTRDALVARFGPDVGGSVPLDCKQDGDDAGVFAKATVYEIWCSGDRMTRWLHKGVETLLDERPYPLRITGRFPCPKPLFGTMTNGCMTPVPDFVQYQDQAKELDDLTGRIAALTKALRLLGFAAGDTAPEIAKGLDSPGEARVVPVPAWAAMGGQKMGDMLVWLPIQEVASVLTGLQALRDRVKADAYEITGVSDILRGQTQADETATAQTLKAQWGGIRVRQRQQEVQRFAAEVLGIMAEVLVGHFDAERLASVGGAAFMAPADQQLVIPALALLKGDQGLLHYRVAVETDSTVETDQAADRASWSEMLQAVAAFMGAMMPVLQGVTQMVPSAAPAFASMTGDLLTGGIRRFKAGASVESSIEAAFEALGQAAQAGPPPAPAQAPPPPKPADPVQMAKVQASLQVAGMRAQAEQQRTQLDAAVAADNSQQQTAQRQVDVARLQLEERKMIHVMQQPLVPAVPGGGGL